ncbi:MAG: hypothetical protein WCO84_08605 [bacterium]
MSNKSTETSPIIDDILRYEDGDMSPEELIQFFQGLIDSGLAWKLQGFYGRQAEALIEAGHCHQSNLC